MARLTLLSLLSLSFAGALVAADDWDHITDIPIFSSLAPCAQSALSYVIDYQTESCGENNNLQSCVCTKDNNYAAIGTSISSSLSWSCGTTATEDARSASVVYSQFCTRDETYTFDEPEYTVSRLVTDVPEFFNLARCAQSAVSYAAIGGMSSLCPSQETLNIPCICTRNQNSKRISSVISSSASWSCENNEDITSAQQFFSAYCGMVNGTTNLPKPSPPPGSMTYYITALDEYSQLAPCAQSALSRAVDRQTYSLCPDGPAALASCVCIKSGMYKSVSLEVTSGVKYSCASTALEDVQSAVNALDYYCSAAKDEVTATVTESVEQTYPAAETGTDGNPDSPLPTETGGPSGSPGGNGDGTGDGTRDGSNDGSDSNNNGGGGSSSSNVGPIAGGVAAGAGIVLIAGLVAWLIMRRKKKAAAAAAAAGDADGGATTVYGPSSAGSPPPMIAGKPELGGAAVMAAPLSPHSPNPSTYKEGTIRTDTVSPISPYGYPPPPMAAELHGQGGLSVPEMPGTQMPPPAELGAPPPAWGHPGPYQMPGQQYGQSLPLPPELQGHSPQGPPSPPQQGPSPPPQAYSPNPPSPHGGAWQYSELPSGEQARR